MLPILLWWQQCLLRALLRRWNLSVRVSPTSISKVRLLRFMCASTIPHRTHKSTPAARRPPENRRIETKEAAAMALAKMQLIVPGEAPENVLIAADPVPEPLRLLEAMLFAASEPLAETELAERLPKGVDVRETLVRLQQE